VKKSPERSLSRGKSFLPGVLTENKNLRNKTPLEKQPVVPNNFLAKLSTNLGNKVKTKKIRGAHILNKIRDDMMCPICKNNVSDVKKQICGHYSCNRCFSFDEDMNACQTCVKDFEKCLEKG
jgi:hypothetical protein